MKRIPFLAFVLLAFAFPAHAPPPGRDEEKMQADKPAEPEVKKSCSIPGMRLAASSRRWPKDFPEDKYDFKPTPAQRSFAMKAVAAARGGFKLLLH